MLTAETKTFVQTTGTAFNLTAYIASLTGAWSKGFQAYLPPNGCKEYHPLSYSAKAGDCTYATNAGFFADVTNPDDHGCVANVIIDSVVYSLTSSMTPSVAVGTDNVTVIFGYVSPEEINATKAAYHTLLSGHVWLVRDGVNYVNVSYVKEGTGLGFVTLHAPRTAIGATASGKLVLVQVDGEELTNKGPDLWQMADIMLGLGAVQAINLDGGGSSESWYNGKVISNANCHDNGVFCERNITSIVCLKA